MHASQSVSIAEPASVLSNATLLADIDKLFSQRMASTFSSMQVRNITVVV
jgi:hypothetical protein